MKSLLVHELLSLFDKTSICDVILSTKRKSQTIQTKGWQSLTISCWFSNTKNASGSPWMSLEHLLLFHTTHQCVRL